MLIRLMRYEIDYEEEANTLFNSDNGDNDMSNVVTHNKNLLSLKATASGSSSASASSSTSAASTFKPFPREKFQFRPDEYELSNEELRCQIAFMKIMLPRLVLEQKKRQMRSREVAVKFIIQKTKTEEDSIDKVTPKYPTGLLEEANGTTLLNDLGVVKW